MLFQSTPIPGSWIFSPNRYPDLRGFFQEDYKLSDFEKELGFAFEPVQANRSMSKAGVVRGIHWASLPPGQAKLVTCSRGAIWDVVVDLRLGSPNFGSWHAEELNERNGKSIYIAEGLGHGFLSLEDSTTVNYLCSTEYNPAVEHAIHPLDEDLGVDFMGRALLAGISDLTVTEDEDKTFKSALEEALLPHFK